MRLMFLIWFFVEVWCVRGFLDGVMLYVVGVALIKI